MVLWKITICYETDEGQICMYYVHWSVREQSMGDCIDACTPQFGLESLQQKLNSLQPYK